MFETMAVLENEEHKIEHIEDECGQRNRMLGCLMALNQMKGFGPRTLRRLLDTMNWESEKVWDADDALLKTHLSKKEREQFLKQRSLLDGIVPDELVAPYHQQGIHLISFQDEHYPELLREIYDPPLLLYVRGNVACLQKTQLAVVGNRKIEEYGRRATQAMVSQVATGLEQAGIDKMSFCITSGLAEGVDGQAHQSALDYGLPTLAVFGCGIDRIFPTFHKALSQQILDKGGALMSEYPLGYPASKETFPRRNRIVSGMAQAVLVVEGSLRSGSLITARLALEEGRQVLAIPGSIFAPGSEGPHQLIRQGALPVTNGYQIIEAMGLGVLSTDGDIANVSNVKERTLEQLSLLVTNGHDVTNKHEALDTLSQEQRQLMALIPASTEQPQGILVDELILKLGWDLIQLNEQLLLLELASQIIQLPGSRVVKS